MVQGVCTERYLLDLAIIVYMHPWWVGNISRGNHNFRENLCKRWQKSCPNSPKNHKYRWYNYTQSYKISFQIRIHLWDIKITNFKLEKLSTRFVRKLLFLYLINEFDFGQDILQGYVSSHYLRVWFLLVNLDDFFAVVCIGFHKDCGFHKIRSLIGFRIRRQCSMYRMFFILG
jgi:hypothetical protein